MNRFMCLIERGQERRGHGSLPEPNNRLVDSERGATQFIDHGGCSDPEASGAVGYGPWTT